MGQIGAQSYLLAGASDFFNGLLGRVLRGAEWTTGDFLTSPRTTRVYTKSRTIKTGPFFLPVMTLCELQKSPSSSGRVLRFAKGPKQHRKGAERTTRDFLTTPRTTRVVTKSRTIKTGPLFLPVMTLCELQESPKSNYGFATTASGSLRERISTASATISSTTSRAGLISPMSPAT